MDEVIYIEKNDVHATLCTWLYCGFWNLWAAEQLGYDGYFNWTSGKFLQSYEDDNKFMQIPNAYNWYFKQPKVEVPPKRKECKVWTWEKENWDSGIDVSPYQFMSQPLSVIRDYYHKHLHFNDETNSRGQLLVVLLL